MTLFSPAMFLFGAWNQIEFGLRSSGPVREFVCMVLPYLYGSYWALVDHRCSYEPKESEESRMYWYPILFSFSFLYYASLPVGLLLTIQGAIYLVPLVYPFLFMVPQILYNFAQLVAADAIIFYVHNYNRFA